MKNFEKLSKMELNIDQLAMVSGGDFDTTVNKVEALGKEVAKTTLQALGEAAGMFIFGGCV